MADRGVTSKLIRETTVENAEQLHRVIVKPRRFEKDVRSKATFAEVIGQAKVGCYVEPEALIPTYEEVLNEVKGMREASLGKPTYVDALDVSEKSNVYAWAMTRNQLKDSFEVAVMDRAAGGNTIRLTRSRRSCKGRRVLKSIFEKKDLTNGSTNGRAS